MGGTILDPVEYARILILPGFDPLDDVLEYMQDWAEDIETVSSAEAEAIARTVWEARLEQQQSWTGAGDYDRLARAFRDLESEGILARMNFACCNRCANQEIDDERTEHPAPPDWYRYREWAYTYFNQQDAAGLAEPHAELLLGYSAFRAAADTPADLLQAARSGDEDARLQVRRHTDRAVGRRVIEAVERHGLATNWGGDPTTRIGVRIADWRKPLPEY